MMRRGATDSHCLASYAARRPDQSFLRWDKMMNFKAAQIVLAAGETRLSTWTCSSQPGKAVPGVSCEKPAGLRVEAKCAFSHTGNAEAVAAARDK